MAETKVVYRVIVNKTVIVHENGVAQANSRSEQIYSQDIEDLFDVRGLIAAVNNLSKPETQQPKA